MTSRGLAISLRFLVSSALRHSRLQASSRYKPIARERRGSLLGRSALNIPGWEKIGVKKHGAKGTRNPPLG
jgi:hypothetical protein